ncbi:hypothetical protein [Aeromonas veronii]|uniref:hypothetical protein n=1 Tax=Aeromonas veronii TaxID=654 RepID=UPI00366B1705
MSRSLKPRAPATPDDTYEDGIKAALLWALGLGPTPLNAEEYQGVTPLQFE